MDANGNEGDMAATRNKNQMRKHQWTTEQDDMLVNCMLELKTDPYWNAGEGNNFKVGFLVQLVKMIEVKQPSWGLKAHPHIQSRHKWMKTRYYAINEMKDASGFAWDDVKHWIDCDQSVFDAWVQSHPSAVGLRHKSFPYFDSLAIIFGKDRANGQNAEDPADVAAAIFTEATINFDEDVYFENQETFVLDDPALQTPMNNIADQSNSSVKSKSNPRKRKVNHEDVLVSSLIDSVNNIGGICEMTSRGVQDVASYFKKLSETNECQDKVYDAIIAVENLGLNDSQILEVAEIIASSQSTSRFFFQLPMDAKKRFLWKKLGLLT